MNIILQVIIIALLSLSYALEKIADTVFDKIFDSVEQKSQKKKKIIIDYLFTKLEDYCYQKNIPIIYGEAFFLNRDRQDCCGTIQYTKTKNNDSTISYKNFVIFVRTGVLGHIAEFSTLAHEIGHYISLTSYNDESEEGADYEADKLVRSFLTKKQQRMLKLELKIFFNEDELKDFKHERKIV